MIFSSIPFLYYFLPAVLIVYFAVPRQAKNAVLLLSSLIFYGWGEPKYVLLMILTITAFYICGLGIGSALANVKLVMNGEFDKITKVAEAYDNGLMETVNTDAVAGVIEAIKNAE